MRGTLRAASPADLEFAWALYAGSMRDLTEALIPWREAGQRRVVADALAAGAEIALVDGAPVGWIQVIDEGDAVLLAQLFVAPEVQGQGIGTALIDGVLARAHAGGRPVRLSVVRGNRAIRLYTRLGFREHASDAVKRHLRWEAPVFGAPPEGVVPRDRPGSYGIAVDGAGRVAVVRTSIGVHLPGGGADPGETEREALAREVREECGLGVASARVVGRATQHIPGARNWIAKRCAFFAIGFDLHGAIAPTEPDHTLEWVPADVARATLYTDAERWAVGEAVRR